MLLFCVLIIPLVKKKHKFWVLDIPLASYMPKAAPSYFMLYISCLVLVLLTQCKTDTLFEVATDTGIDFENTLTESETENILAYEYFYNGGGVAAADFDNDGYTDLFFVGNQVPSKLYRNKGKSLQFEDITQKSGISHEKNTWSTGVAVADINADGWIDIYLCRSGNGAAESRKNQLFINNQNGGFTEQAERYGIADTGYSTHATFLDYDRDGDLDLFVMNHNLKNYERKEAAFMKTNVDTNAGDRLYRNDSQGFFSDVTLAAHIKSNALGFGLGVVVADFNQDNWPDLYVANDYVEEDYLYLNQANGTFRECAKEVMGHFSYSAMGTDAADFNNDGLPDIFTADMLPEDNRRQKLLAFPDNWNVQQSMLANGFHWQNMRNMLQLNTGKGVLFAEIGQLAGVSNTDWSWSPVFADLDNDGFKDLFVSNGFVRDLSDLDFVKYLSNQETIKQQGQAGVSLVEQVQQMPKTPTHHYVFKNKGDLTFDNNTDAWGLGGAAIASGAVCVDLDNDGDLDIVTNNTNEPARIYHNTQQQKKPQSFLKINLKYTPSNTYAIGTKLYVYTKDKQQYIEAWPTHGFQSSNQSPLHIGLGSDVGVVDSIKIVWPDGSIEVKKKITTNQSLLISPAIDRQKTTTHPQTLPIETHNAGLRAFAHTENLSIDFNRQILIPYLYSWGGAKVAVGDINADGLDDVYFCGALNQAAQLLTQNTNGSFTATKQLFLQTDAVYEDRDAVFFDADGDGDLDLYVVSGGYELITDDPLFEDRLYLNNGRGMFSKTMVPKLLSNKSCVKAGDLDTDGDIDLFLGGGVSAGRFPLNEKSYILTNNGKGVFTKTAAIDLGLVTDAAIAKTASNKNPTITIAAEWKPIQAISLQPHSPRPQVVLSQISPQSGWWSSIVADDLDNDGDIDFVVGNLGLNTQLKASQQQPISLYFNDFDQSGSIDPFITYFIQNKAYPLASRDEALEQMPSLRKKFTDYKSYSTATIEDILTSQQLEKAQKYTITETRTGLLINDNGTFRFKPLPTQAQLAPVYAIGIDDLNKDGKKDVILAGNNATMRIRIGKMDANHGVILLGNGQNEFEYLPQNQSKLWLNGDIKSCKTVRSKKDSFWVFSTNNASPQIYKK
jgi:enediyne biosynthesis protein E4